MDYAYALRGDGQMITRNIKEEQFKALNAVIDCIDPKVLVLPDKIVSIIPPRPAGYNLSRELFRKRTGLAFDALSPAETAVDFPLSFGWQNYYCYFIKRDLNDLWRFVNRRLEKWCKWNKRMSLRKSRKWLNTLYKMQPSLFAHWSVCPAY